MSEGGSAPADSVSAAPVGQGRLFPRQVRVLLCRLERADQRANQPGGYLLARGLAASIENGEPVPTLATIQQPFGKPQSDSNQ